MLKPQDIIIEVFTGADGDSMKITHMPTGIYRAQGPPMNKPGKTQHELLREIEGELMRRGLTQHILLRCVPKVDPI
jgi:hypothetical protein